MSITHENLVSSADDLKACLRVAADGGANRILDVCNSEDDDSSVFVN